MKWCNDCKTWLTSEGFYKDKKSPDGLDYFCKSCRKKRKSTKTQVDYQKEYRLRNKGSRDEASKKWRELNPDKANKHSANYRALKLRAKPVWLSVEQEGQIRYIYQLARECSAISGNQYHVDHIIPLRGKDICGLHVPWNLQVLPAEQNIRKSNSLDRAYMGVANG